AVGILSLSAPRLVATQWARFTDPFGDHPPYASIDFQVTPGDVRLVYGSPLDVRATPVGGAVDKVELTFRTNDGSVESVPMFPEPGGAWRATIADVTLPGRYDVHGPGARSRQFRFDVITVPEWRGVRFRITPPAYTHRPPYEGPLPQGGIAGLPGTKVQLWAKSNRPLAGGTLDLAGSATTAPSTQPA